VRAILTYADRLAARGHAVTVVVPARSRWRAAWRALAGAGPDWMSGFRARVAWVGRWDAATLGTQVNTDLFGTRAPGLRY